MADEMMIQMQQNQSKTFTTEFRGVRYDYYLTGSIGEAEDYVDLCNILRSASSQDEVVIRINSPGGQVHTGNMIINAIQESEANVVGFIESTCGSMATFIFLACHSWGVSESAEFFSHTCSYGTWGKESENFSQVDFFRKQYNGLMRKRYQGFYSEEEIEKLIRGEDIWLNADEILERLQSYSEAQQAQGCGNPDCTECGEEGEDFNPQQSLHDMISEAVARGVEDALAKRDKVEAAKLKKSSKKPVDKVSSKD